ncbi:hypothetical protein BGZ93_002582 [Podila epicladia]|nr:hypothetical protein BGZ93_002582 [Podila epicladia]
MFTHNHIYVWLLRLLLVVFTIVVGSLYAASRSLYVKEGPDLFDKTIHKWDPRDAAATALFFVIAIMYTYSAWGKQLIPTKLRTFLVFSLAYSLIFLTISPLMRLSTGSSSNGEKKILGCWPGEDACQIERTAQILGVIAGFLVLLEAILTARIGPLDPDFKKHRYQSTGGYHAGADVMMVRPDQVPVQPQVPTPMHPQPYSYQQPLYLFHQQQQQQQPQPPNPHPEEIQHHPLPQAPHAITTHVVS